MKAKIIILSVLILFILDAFSQDTTNYYTGSCISSGKKAFVDCPQGINFKYENDSLIIYGTVGANCAGTHLVVVEKINDSLIISTIDTGKLATCSCLYCFEIRLLSSIQDTIVKFNGTIYNTKKLSNIVDNVQINSQIDVYPIPTERILNIELNASVIPNRIDFFDLTGRHVIKLESTSSIIDISKLVSGSYLMILTLGNHERIIKKVIKK